MLRVFELFQKRRFRKIVFVVHRKGHTIVRASIDEGIGDNKDLMPLGINGDFKETGFGEPVDGGVSEGGDTEDEGDQSQFYNDFVNFKFNDDDDVDEAEDQGDEGGDGRGDEDGGCLGDDEGGDGFSDDIGRDGLADDAGGAGVDDGACGVDVDDSADGECLSGKRVADTGALHLDDNLDLFEGYQSNDDEGPT